MKYTITVYESLYEEIFVLSPYTSLDKVAPLVDLRRYCIVYELDVYSKGFLQY